MQMTIILTSLRKSTFYQPDLLLDSLSLVLMSPITYSQEVAGADEKGVSSENQQERPLWLRLEATQENGTHKVIAEHKKAAQEQGTKPRCPVPGLQGLN